MPDGIEIDFGKQPIAKLMELDGLTPNVQHKILDALNKAAKKNYTLKDLFNY